MSTAFLGMRGTGDWGTDVRPKNFREMIAYLFPNGDAPLTAINAMGNTESTDDPEFSHWDKAVEAQGGALAGDGIYTTSALATAKTTTAAAGTLVYASVSSAETLSHFRPGHTCLLVNDAKPLTERVFGSVMAVAADHIVVKVRAAADAASISNANYIDVAGNANPEGGVIPDSINYDPTKRTNYTQIFRTSLDITRTARKTRYRTGDAKTELRRDALQYHSIEMEWSRLFGEKVEISTSDENGKPLRFSQGAIPFINEFQSDHLIDYKTDTAGSPTAIQTGDSWLSKGEDWLDEKFEVLFREGSSERLGLIGSGALLGIQKLVKQSGVFSLSVETGAYGIKVVRWHTSFGDVLLKRHPLFSKRSYMLNSMLLVDPQNIGQKFIDDTMWKPDPAENEGGFTAVDGTKDEFLTEAGWVWQHPSTMMCLSSIGLDA